MREERGGELGQPYSLDSAELLAVEGSVVSRLEVINFGEFEEFSLLDRRARDGIVLKVSMRKIA